MKEPTRLCDGDQLPSALRDAFRALEHDAPSAQVVVRVQQALHALPVATPGALAVSALSTGKLVALTTLLVGSLASVVLLRSEGALKPAARSSESSAAESVAPAQAAPLHGESTRVAPARDDEPAAAPSAAAAVPHAGARAERSAPQAGARSTARAGDRPSRGKSTASSASTAQASSTAVESSVAAEVPAASVNDDTTPTPDEPAPSAAVSHAVEAKLLVQAKRLATRDPEAALRHVEALAARFPDGVFVQERSLLAIQLHRRLGHTALAEQLARQFQDRYPRSVYRRALPP
jgi:hypothetical protein